MKKKAIVTGVGGQDGYLMSELLLTKGYDVVGIVHDMKKYVSGNDVLDIAVREMDFRDYNLLYELVKEECPDEIYNFAAQSSSIGSWDKTRETLELNLMAPTAFLEGIRDYARHCKFFQASSAEIFGKNPFSVPQDESTRVNPSTPYSTAKTAIGFLIENYRNEYGIFANNGIFYNHESIRRKESFLPAKIARTVAKIKAGTADCLYVGNIYSKRDWGYAPDYMEAAWRTMQLESPDDYIFATGDFHSVKDMISVAFYSVGIPIEWSGGGVNEVAKVCGSEKIVVRIDEKFYRKYDRCDSIGNPNKLYLSICWKPHTSFEEMVSNMTNYFLEGENV